MTDAFLPLLVLLGLIAVVVMGALIRMLRRANGRDISPWPVYARRLLTVREQQCFYRFQSTFPDHIVLAQVSMAQLVGVKKTSRSKYQATLNRFRLLTVDFVLCRKDFGVAAVFELDGASHDHPRRQDRDQRKSEVLAAAGIRLIRVNSAAIPSAMELRELVEMVPPTT